MRNFQKVKALERLQAELSKLEYETSQQTYSYTVLAIQINTLLPQDISHILDVLADAINNERNK